jgi:hypothetical protein
MLHDLERGQPTETVVRQSRQVGEGIGMVRREATCAAFLDHLGVGVHTNRSHSALTE